MTKEEFESLDAYEKLEALQKMMDDDELLLNAIFDKVGYWKMHDILTEVFEDWQEVNA